MRADLFLTLADRYGMLPEGAGILCAVSGGADSMYLLHRTLELAGERRLTVFAAHFEHGLRGEESLRDAAFVSEHCRKLGVPLALGHGDVPACAAEKGIGIEDAARTLRYHFLEETAEKLDCDRIATAHNADDNVETVLMNLCRGAGLKGLTGIPPVRGAVVRPMLETDRAEIEAWLRERGIAWVEDSSNGSDDYTRNRIRHRVIPLLREENPRLTEAVSRTAELLRRDEAFLDGEARRFLERFSSERDTRSGSLPAADSDSSSEEGRSSCAEIPEGETVIAVPCRELRKLEPVVASRVLRLLCGSGVSMERNAALLRFAEGNGRGVLELPGLKIRRERGMLLFPKRKADKN